jgi:molybdate transport system substrate-binding protein
MSRTTAAAAAALVVAMSGCSGSSAGPAPGAKRTTPATVTVFAASSLTNAFAAEAAAFAQRSGQRTTFSFAGSQALVAQVRQGAPADVVATADLTTMAKLAGGRAARVFARNRLVIITARGNPKHVTGLVDLARADLVVVLAARTVPAGRYAAQALATAGVTVHAKSLEDNVRGVLTKVQLGEADAGIVYASDAKSAARDLTAVPIPGAPVASYPVLVLHPVGQAFADFLLSAEGQAILARYDFLSPR